ncbi:hypothetical protein GOP47_0003095 [Adiantum capillus-veneris]|uniref:HhH-GPD domain-containing protein n=1 Tax=Adiantum capillus-veneris TaxID=13818 RepID=A0A9D4VDB3_ADICA|nr:hypothetical protein GOP47_0003095 [Adiantum capillus-veneris]
MRARRAHGTPALIRKSQRLCEQKYITHVENIDGGLVLVKSSRKQSLCSRQKRNVMGHCDDIYDYDDEDDYDDSNDDIAAVYKKGYDGKDWMPKSQGKNHDVQYHDTHISNCHAFHDSMSTPDIDNVKSHDDQLYQFLANNDYDDDDDHIKYGRNASNAGCFNSVTYVSRKRKFSQSIQRYEKQRGSWRKVCLPVHHNSTSWKNKKPRMCHRKEHRISNWVSSIFQPEKGSCNQSFKKGSESPKSFAMPAGLEGSQSLSTSLQPSSPPVFLTTVLDGLPKEDTPTEALPEAWSACRWSSPTTDDTSPCQMEKQDVYKGKSEGREELTQKLKRKKHRAKVLCDTFDKAKHVSESRKKQLAEQRKDMLLKKKKTKLRRTPRAKKEQDGEESAIKITKRHTRKRGTTLTAKNGSQYNAKNGIILRENNLRPFTLSTLGERNSLVPFQSNVQTDSSNSSKDKFALLNSIMREVLNAQGLPPPYSREELCNNLSSYVAESQVRLSQELMNYIQGYSQKQQLVASIDANNSPLSLEVTKEAHTFSLVQSKPVDSTELLLTQEPNNQLELVAYDLRREMITLKSRRMSSKCKAKVQLDIESERIWPLLALGGIPEKFEDSVYMKRERAVMRRRVETFIYSMKSVQGDRHFSPWKGSILDSLVGAFLTQNVSDHLSSSAVMSIASRYPFKQENDSAKFEDTFEAVETQNRDSTQAKPESRIPCVVQSETQEKNENVSNINNQDAISSSCRMPVQCMKISTNETSLRAIKKALRNTTANHIQLRRTVITCEEDKDKSDGLDLYKSSTICSNECACCSTTSPSITMDLLARNNLSSTLHNVRTPPKESHSPHEQSKPEKSFEQRTEVYVDLSVCRSLFENHIPKQIVGNKKHRVLGGVERAHLEENHIGRKKGSARDWEILRKFTLQSCSGCESASRKGFMEDTYQDLVDWDAVRCASVEELAATIKERGMHHILSGRIKAFLKTIHEEQGNMDLEWLRKVSPENAKEYLTSIHGLGVKSVECIRLLALHHVAFPVDVNVGRILIRLGWVPLEPLPKDLELHSLEEYPIQETIQKYLWPRLCSLDQKTLYELHYHLITFGKVICTKKYPNCKACPMRTDCKYFASAYASSKLLLTEIKDDLLKRLETSTQVHALTNSSICRDGKAMIDGVSDEISSFPHISEVDCDSEHSCLTSDHYYIEEPASPETTHDSDIDDIEDFPSIYRSSHDFTKDLLEVFSGTTPTSVEATHKSDSQKTNIQNCSAIVDSSHRNSLKETFSESLTELCSTTMHKSSHDDNTKEQFNLKGTFSESLTELCSTTVDKSAHDDKSKEQFNLKETISESLTELCSSTVDKITYDDNTKEQIKLKEMFSESLTELCSTTVDKSAHDDNTKEQFNLMETFSEPLTELCSTTVDKSSHDDNTKEQFNSTGTLSESLTELSPGYHSDTFPIKNASIHHSTVCQDTSVVREATENAIVSLQGAYIPAPKLKSMDRLRTIHYVYKLPDTHPLLEQADIREKDDPSLYLLAIWSPGEALSSLQGLDDNDSCNFSFSNPNEMVKGTLLIPCRTAMRGKFPLNGTYFQVNEVFADHASSLEPLQVPRSYIWSLERCFVYFGTSVTNIFRGLTLDEIKTCFLRGHVCVRGFDRAKRAPRPLVCRLHFPISKQTQRPKRNDQETFSK